VTLNTMRMHRGCPFLQLAFTGSTEVGKLIATETAKNVVPTTLELVRHACLL
jgi:hypothetical protein